MFNEFLNRIVAIVVHGASHAALLGYVKPADLKGIFFEGFYVQLRA